MPQHTSHIIDKWPKHLNKEVNPFRLLFLSRFSGYCLFFELCPEKTSFKSKSGSPLGLIPYRFYLGMPYLGQLVKTQLVNQYTQTCFHFWICLRLLSYFPSLSSNLFLRQSYSPFVQFHTFLFYTGMIGLSLNPLLLGRVTICHLLLSLLLTVEPGTPKPTTSEDCLVSLSHFLFPLEDFNIKEEVPRILYEKSNPI